MAEIVFRLLLAAILGYAALAKLSAPRASLAGLGTYGFPDSSLRPVAWASLVALELALAIGVGLDVDAAAYAAAGLMALFAALEVGQILRGKAGAPCACFGPRSKVSWLGVARDAALAAGFALVPSLDSISIATQGWLGIAAGVALVACAVLGVAVLALAREVGMLRLRLGTQGALEIEGEGPELSHLPDPRPGDRERCQGSAGRGRRLRRGGGGGAVAEPGGAGEPLRGRSRC
jgi:hypothetical protein